jgi:hypothetical protein
LLEGSNDSWPQDDRVHLSAVEGREVEEIEKRSVDSSAKLGGSAADNRL